jgi:hypothetical protein
MTKAEQIASTVLANYPNIVKPWRDLAEIRAVLARIFAGESEPEVVEALKSLVCDHSHHDYETLASLCMVLGTSPKVSPTVLGTALSEIMPGGKMYSGVRLVPRALVIDMLKRAAPATLMPREEDRVVFNALPDMVEAWRGGTGITARRAAVGFSWTIDPKVAHWFARRWKGHHDSMVIKAIFPKSAIFAYWGDRKESELVINWRHARQLRPLWASWWDDQGAVA